MKNAFTMIELIFVIVILGILAAIAVPKLGGVKEKAELTKAVAQFTTVLNDVMVNYNLNDSEIKNKDAAINVGSLSGGKGIELVTNSVKDDGKILMSGSSCGAFALTGTSTATGLQFTPENWDADEACETFFKHDTIKGILDTVDGSAVTIDLDTGKKSAS